jgi:hypothetical protein
MEWVSALAGFALGLLSSYLILRVQRGWQRNDDAAYAKKIVESLITEIEEGLGRAKYMASLAESGSASYGRIYTALWDSSNQRLAATLPDTNTLSLLHRIYYRFDLVNFNCEAGRPGPGGAFARDYVAEIEDNLAKLKTRLAKHA